MEKSIASLKDLLHQASVHHGGAAVVREKMPVGILAADEIAAIPDHRFLSEMTRAIFRAGSSGGSSTTSGPASRAHFTALILKPALTCRRRTSIDSAWTSESFVIAPRSCRCRAMRP